MKSLPLALLGAGVLAAAQLMAADHAEAPAVSSVADKSVDIADVYLFRAEKPNTIVAMVTFGGVSSGGNTPPRNPIEEGGTYDPDVLYAFSIDTDPDDDGDNIVAEHTIYARFGFDGDGNAAVKMENVPGVAAPIVGPVETIVTSPEGFRVYAGLRDDPFFFDTVGFGQTLNSIGRVEAFAGPFAEDLEPLDDSGDLCFSTERDTFGFRNLTAIVFEMDARVATQGGNRIRFWGTTSRFVDPAGGNP